MATAERLGPTNPIAWEPLVLLRDGKELSVRFALEDIEKQPVGEGEYGEIHRVRIQLPDIENKRRWPRDNSLEFPTAILKVYKSLDERHMRHAQNIYEEVRATGVETWKTYSMVKNWAITFMTDGSSGINKNDLIVSVNNDSLDRQKLESLLPHAIDNFEACIGQALFDVERLSKTRLHLPEDAWFVRFSVKPLRDNTHHANIRLFPGDFDACEKVRPFETDGLLPKNVEIVASICAMLATNILPISTEDKDRYVGISNEIRAALQDTRGTPRRNLLALAKKYQGS